VIVIYNAYGFRTCIIKNGIYAFGGWFNSKFVDRIAEKVYLRLRKLSFGQIDA